MLRALHDLRASEAEDEDVADHPEEGHSRGVKGPPLHEAQGGAAEGVGEGVEALVLFGFRGVGLDLADPRDVVVEEGVHVAGGLALAPVAITGVAGVDPGPDGEEGDRKGGPEGDFRVGEVHHRPDGEDLDQGHEAELDAIDEDSLHGGDVLDHPGHDVPGAAAVEPAQGKALELLVEVGADVVDDPLFEVIIEDNAGAIHPVAEEKGSEGEEDPEEELGVLFGIGDDFVEDVGGHIGKNDHRKSHQGGTDQLSPSEEGIPL